MSCVAVASTTRRLSVIDGPNSGGTRSLTLVAGTKAPASGSPELASGQATNRLRVLVVDDEPDNLMLIDSCLRRSFEVHTATSAEAGLALLKAGSYDLIISDQRMPGKTGTDFLAESLQYAPSSIRIIVTAFCDLEVTVDAINRAAISGFLHKPFTPAALDTTIARATRLGTMSHGSVQAAPAPRQTDRGALLGLAERAGCGLAIVRQDELLYANATMRHLWGAAEAATTTLAGVRARVHAEDLPAFEACMTSAKRVQEGACATSRVRFCHDGHVTAAQLSVLPLGRGETDELILHAWIDEEACSAGDASSEAAQATVGAEPARILFIDAHQPMLDALRRAYGKTYRVATASSSVEARAFLEREADVDLIVCDADLPRSSGVELYRHLAAQGSPLSHRFVFVSGEASASSPDVRLPDTGYPTLGKPFALAEIDDLVRRALGERAGLT